MASFDIEDFLKKATIGTSDERGASRLCRGARRGARRVESLAKPDSPARVTWFSDVGRGAASSVAVAG